ncbi:HD domain-containing protein [Streptomyces sp. NPDC059009]|uniref:HD domain-containing protein n=1 Tax=Streptomyces sp. NPDC059009 TaxID=3346694 RepID=UPI00367A6ED8
MKWVEWLPELTRIGDDGLRDRTVDVLTEAARRGGWADPSIMSYVEETASGAPPVVRTEVKLVDHLQLVAAAAADMAEQCNRVVGSRTMVDHVLAGGLLHDVGLFELFGPKSPTEPAVPVLRQPLLLRHPYTGARLAEEMGLPTEVVHIIATHSVEGEHTKRSKESALVHWADWATYDVMREALFPNVPQERAFYYSPGGAS